MPLPYNKTTSLWYLMFVFNVLQVNTVQIINFSLKYLGFIYSKLNSMFLLCITLSSDLFVKTRKKTINHLH